jgi:hypothetical protein
VLLRRHLCSHLFPNILPNCPYRTPFSRDSPKWILVVSTALALLGIYCLPCFVHTKMFEMICIRLLLFVQSLLWTLSDTMRSLQEDIDKKALQWTVATIVLNDDIEALLEGIPGYLTRGRNAIPIVEGVFDLQHSKPLGHHINQLIQTCTQAIPRQSQRDRERAQAPGPYLPRHRTILDRSPLFFVLIWDVRILDVAFSQLVETGR